MDETTPSRSPSRAVVVLLVGVLCLVWGSTWLVISEGLRDLPPMTSLSARFVIAAIVLAFVARPLARIEGGERPTWRITVVYAVLTLAIPYAIIYWVETRLPSGLVSVLWSVYPILLAVSAHAILPQERMRARQWFGMLLGFTGVTLMFWTDVRSVGPDAVPMGLVLLLSPLASALGTPIIKRDNHRTSSVYLNRDGTVVGAVICVALALTFDRGASVDWTPRAVFSVLYLAIVGTVVAFGLYFWLLRHAPATFLSLIAFVIPVVALTLGALVGGEEVRFHTVVGLALILSGVAAVVLGNRSRAGKRNGAVQSEAAGSE